MRVIVFSLIFVCMVLSMTLAHSGNKDEFGGH